MKTKTLLLAALLSLPTRSLAQGGPPPGKGGGMGAARLFDAKAVTTVSGTVVGENRVDRGMGHKGVHLVVKTADGELVVHLGPDFYVDAQPVKLAAGDAVTVKGSRITFDGKPTLLAVTVTKGGTTITFRDDLGRPAWSGGAKK